MLALKISDVRGFMNQLLVGSAFDSFYVSEASITTFCHFSIDGTLQKDFFDSDAADELRARSIDYAFWKDIRPHCFSIIKGKLPPLKFRMVLLLRPDQLPSEFGAPSSAFVTEKVRTLFLNIQYHDQKLACTTGISTQTFSLTKEAEREWDSMILNFFKKHGLIFEV